jgi:hypothetical protein
LKTTDSIGAVVALDAVIAQTGNMNPGYEDGLVAGMMDFLNGWFSNDAYRRVNWPVPGSYEDEFSLGYRLFVPSPTDHSLSKTAPIR